MDAAKVERRPEREEREGAKSRHKRGIPPPIWVAKGYFIPIIFRTKNIEKSHLERVIIFRTRNTKKSHLGRMVDIEKFSEFFLGECFGEKEMPPILVEIRGEVLILKI